MGDEYGHTKGGNNNTYCHDNYLNYFQWDKKEESSLDFFRFCCLVTKFHQECESMGLDDFPTSKRLQWHGHFPGMPDWSETSRFVAFTMVERMDYEVAIENGRLMYKKSGKPVDTTGKAEWIFVLSTSKTLYVRSRHISFYFI
ncbi:isoamylase 1, chloroplastic-like isoform X2 [Vigna radiata var. radiata]|uniref:Isoamylase 1, chloroplastic-like isoform X2 n=1 Tax=Vigna radiata var. radiata TaxID=3916 RepID=A0A3Q0ELC2_VIGRR|nr:isoamylase 1, chloroplastic-like isoform X2 [Vigna radiata var. radiata]